MVGVDGCRGGWVAALAAPGGAVLLHRQRFLSDVVEWAADESAAAVAVDIPIGLPSPDAWRACDIAARRLLGPAAPRVFLTPPRVVVEAWRDCGGLPYRERYAAARAVARPGHGLAAQTAGLLDKMLEADALARAGGPLVEVHPELSFRAMAGAVLPPKRTAPGATARRDALHRAWPALDASLVRDDDDADALAAAWSAARLACGAAEQVPPGEPPRDAVGLPMRIAW